MCWLFSLINSYGAGGKTKKVPASLQPVTSDMVRGYGLLSM